MAWSKEATGRLLIRNLESRQIELSDDIKINLRQNRGLNLFGYNCLLANLWSETSVNIKVCTSWFNSTKMDFQKPSVRYSGITGGSDFQLIPTSEGLYAIYYLALRDYALKLEDERDYWFQKTTWGMDVNPTRGTFRWRGGNTIDFPMTPVCHNQCLALRENQYLTRSEDLGSL
jgi:hypothetical protein